MSGAERPFVKERISAAAQALPHIPPNRPADANPKLR
jgi:hypothetical protein